MTEIHVTAIHAGFVASSPGHVYATNSQGRGLWQDDRCIHDPSDMTIHSVEEMRQAIQRHLDDNCLCLCGHEHILHVQTPHGAPCDAVGCYCGWFAQARF